MNNNADRNQKQTISIMADFGMGPYAWLREVDENPPYVGSNIADAVGGFIDEIPVTKNLEENFKKWVIEFENDYDKKDFDWEKWNTDGIRLAYRLKEEIGETYEIEYHFPSEYPNLMGYPEWFIIKDSFEESFHL
jgi:hypothetical protein